MWITSETGQIMSSKCWYELLKVLGMLREGMQKGWYVFVNNWTFTQLFVFYAG